MVSGRAQTNFPGVAPLSGTRRAVGAQAPLETPGAPREKVEDDPRGVAWPVPGHFPGDPVRSRSVYREWIGWLDTHLNPQPDGTPASPSPGDKSPALPDEVKPAATGASPR